MNIFTDENCGCPKIQEKIDEMNELNDQTSYGNEITVPHVYASDVQEGGGQSLVYAIGSLGYDFGSEARRDSFIQNMRPDQMPDKKPDSEEPNPYSVGQMVKFLDGNPEYAASLIWTLEIGGSPVYAIRPIGSFSVIAYQRLTEYLSAQNTENADRLSLPGIIRGKTKLLSGQVVPVIIPEVRGMYNWSIPSLVKSVIRPTLRGVDDSDIADTLTEFLERLYYALMNTGRTPSERALNYIGTNLYMALSFIPEMLDEKLALDTIIAVQSSVCRVDSDCWDVQITLFDPENVTNHAREVFALTVDVSDVVPVTIGTLRHWKIWKD